MNLKFVKCLVRKKKPKVNVSVRRSVNKKTNRKKRKNVSSHRNRLKSSYVSSNLYSRNFYPANYFFQDESKSFGSNREGVNNRNGIMITRNTPQFSQKSRSKTFPQQPTNFWHKVGSYFFKAVKIHSSLKIHSKFISKEIKLNSTNHKIIFHFVLKFKLEDCCRDFHSTFVWCINDISNVDVS